MANSYFDFCQFRINQEHCSQKVSTDACLFGAWVARNTFPKGPCLDIGAGTGLLMLMLAQQHTNEIDGIEIEPRCAEQLRENIIASPWSERLTCHETDARIFRAAGKYGLIISNPPFYENQLKAVTSQKNLAWHSSDLTLAELFNIANEHLENSGLFAVIMPFPRMKETIEEGRKYEFNPARILTVRHTLKHPFTRVMIIFSKTNSNLLEESLEIRNDDGSYTDHFRSLLTGYYLYL